LDLKKAGPSWSRFFLSINQEKAYSNVLNAITSFTDLLCNRFHSTSCLPYAIQRQLIENKQTAGNLCGI
jgi:TonB family protein